MKNVLVVAAHPDDEVLGCGGAIARHAADGDAVTVLILAEGSTSRSAVRDREAAAAELSELAKAANKANALLGVSTVLLRDFPDNRMDSVDLLDIVKSIEAVMSTRPPDVVYTHHAGDVNIDHRRIHEAVIAACRATPGQSVRQLLYFEVPSSSEWQTPGSAPAFQPHVFINIESTLARKLEALDCYASEMRDFPHPRSNRAVEALARWRGASAGFMAAEAFVLGRLLIG